MRPSHVLQVFPQHLVQLDGDAGGGAVGQRRTPVGTVGSGLSHRVDPVAHVERLANVGDALPHRHHVLHREWLTGDSAEELRNEGDVRGKVAE